MQKKKFAIKTILGGMFALVATFALIWGVGRPVFHEFKGSFAMKEFQERGVLGTYRHRFFTFFGRVDEMAKLDQENEDLTEKLAHMEKKLVIEESKQVERELASLNEMLEEKLNDQAGSELATALKTIQYEIPMNLSYAQLHSLAIGFLKKEEFDKAAILMNHLLTLKDESKFKVPDNYLLSGIAWYFLKNYHLADQQVQEALKTSHPADDVHRSASLWEAMIQKKLGKTRLSQESLLKFLEHYPHSEEAAMINGNRKPASKQEEKNTHDEDAHHEE